MADEIDLRIAEIDNENKKLALEGEKQKTAQANAEARGRKSEGWLKFVVGGIIGAVAAYGTAYLEYSGQIQEAEFNYQNRDREIDLELAKLSLTILSGEYDQDDVENSLPARMFALRALSTGTGVVISDADMDTWARTGVTPASKEDIWGVTQEITGKSFGSSSVFGDGLAALDGCVTYDTDQEACGAISKVTGAESGCVLQRDRVDKDDVNEFCGRFSSRW